MSVEQVLETCLYAKDLKAAESFYREILGLKFHAREEGRHVFFFCGPGMLLLFNPEATETETPGFDLPRHGAYGPGHVCFAVGENEIENWKDRLTARGVEIEKEWTWPSGGRSLYFRDPAGNSVELGTRSIWPLANTASGRPSSE